MSLNVFVLIPSALKGHALITVDKWRAKGYKTGLFVDPHHSMEMISDAQNRADLLIVAKYPGVWASWNILAKAAVRLGADVCVLVGDDMDPDPKRSAQEIGEIYLSHFPTGFGVYQPTGDNQGEVINGRWNSQRIAGSPWVGREWIERSYGGRGPVDARFTAFYADEAIQLVAEKLGVFVQDATVAQWHRHWSFKGGLPRQQYHERNQLTWDQDKRLFEASRALGFPEAEPLPKC